MLPLVPGSSLSCLQNQVDQPSKQPAWPLDVAERNASILQEGKGGLGEEWPEVLWRVKPKFFCVFVPSESGNSGVVQPGSEAVQLWSGLKLSPPLVARSSEGSSREASLETWGRRAGHLSQTMRAQVLFQFCI